MLIIYSSNFYSFCLLGYPEEAENEPKGGGYRDKCNNVYQIKTFLDCKGYHHREDASEEPAEIVCKAAGRATKQDGELFRKVKCKDGENSEYRYALEVKVKKTRPILRIYFK